MVTRMRNSRSMVWWSRSCHQHNAVSPRRKHSAPDPNRGRLDISLKFPHRTGIDNTLCSRVLGETDLHQHTGLEVVVL